MSDEPFDVSKMNLGNIMGMARNFQEKMEKIQEQLAGMTVQASVGGDMVTVTANGKQQIISIQISSELINMKDQAMMQDLVQAAVNEALERSRGLMKEQMSKLTGGIPLPGIFP